MDKLDFVTVHLFNVGVRHAASVADILRLIERLEELQTYVHGMMKHPHPATTLLFDMLWLFSK